MNGLSYHDLHCHFWECGVCIQDASLAYPALEKVVIRGIDGDYELAAIHRDGKVLVFDLGQKVDDGL